MSAFMDFRCEGCGRRFGQLVKGETKVVLCPKCGREIDLVAFSKMIDEAKRSILDRAPEDGGRLRARSKRGTAAEAESDTSKHDEAAGD